MKVPRFCVGCLKADLKALDADAPQSLGGEELSNCLLQPTDRLVSYLANRFASVSEVQVVKSQGEPGAVAVNVDTGSEEDVNVKQLEEGKQGHGGSSSVEARIRRRLQCIYLAVGAATIMTCYYFHLLAASTDGGLPGALSCRAALLRYGTEFGGSKCGLWGSECKPIDEWLPMRCPALCGLGLTDPIDSRVIGSLPYRADSRVCIAAWHAGVIGWGGGCFDARIGAGASSYQASSRNGVESVAFDSWYPFSLEFRASAGARHCGYDGTPVLLCVNVILVVGFLWLRPPKRLFFWTMITAFWWYCGLVSPMEHKSVSECFRYMGRFTYFVFGAEVLLWHIGNAKCTFPDTAAGAVLDVIILEILPFLATLHWHLLSYVAGGSYSLNGALFQSWEGPLAFLLGLAVLLPLVLGVLNDWRRAGLLTWVLGRVLAIFATIIGLTLIFSSAGWGLHLHHYFIALLCYLGSRGRSRLTCVARALCLGAVINGLSHWGETDQIPIWTEGSGWYPPSGEISSGAWGRGEQVIFTAAEATNNADEILLRWGLYKDLGASNCSLATYEPEEDGTIFVVEMNHVEIYRGPGRSLVAPLFASVSSDSIYVRVGRIATGLSRTASSASQVLALHRGPTALAWPYGSNIDDCAKVEALTVQPEWSLDGYI